MSLDLYTLEILKYNRVTLGRAEQLFLTLMMGKSKEPRSAYSVWSILKERGIKMAYKNVHTRIKRLEELNLIETVPKKAKYGAIEYKLTTQGLMYQISRFVNIDDTLSWSDFLDNYSDHIIFKTLIFPYFEEDTINHANFTLYFEIVFYLGDCYRITLEAADKIRKAIEKHDKNAKEYYAKKLKEDLEWQPREFAFKLVTNIAKQKGGGSMIGRLAKDKRFVELLSEVHRDFDRVFTAMNNIRSKL